MIYTSSNSSQLAKQQVNKSPENQSATINAITFGSLASIFYKCSGFGYGNLALNSFQCLKLATKFKLWNFNVSRHIAAIPFPLVQLFLGDFIANKAQIFTKSLTYNAVLFPITGIANEGLRNIVQNFLPSKILPKHLLENKIAKVVLTSAVMTAATIPFMTHNSQTWTQFLSNITITALYNTGQGLIQENYGFGAALTSKMASIFTFSLLNVAFSQPYLLTFK